jgi:small GTP-binding protein
MTNKIANYDYLVKILLIGDSGVGKSSLLIRYSENTFTDNFSSTIGIDFRIKTIDVNDKRIKLQIWDTSGLERFKTVTGAYYRNVMGIFLVYDVSNIKSFQNINNWLKNVKKNASDEKCLMLIGNKCDKEEREVSFEIGKQLADELNIKFIETSAKSTINIDEIFTEMAINIIENMNNEYSIIDTNIIELDKNNYNYYNKLKSCCNLL